MKILIVGGGGFVGSWLTHELLSKKHKVVIIDPFIYFTNWDKKKIKIINKFKEENLFNNAVIYRKRFEDCGKTVIKKEKPDIVIHLAGIPLEKIDDFDISHRQLTDDIGLTYQVIKSVKENLFIKKFVFMSSIAAYGDCNDIISENFPLKPKTPYGIMKASGEFLTQSELSNWNIVRTTNVYGFGDMNNRASNIIIDKILKEEKFWINSNIVMDFINVKDLVKGIANVALKASPKEVFHISGGKAIGLDKFVDELENFFKVTYEIKNENDRPKRGTMANKKARVKIAWKPKMNLKSGIKDYIKYVKKYKIS